MTSQTNDRQREEWIRWAKRKEARSRCALAPLLIRAYRFPTLRPWCRRLARRLEGGEFMSCTLRDFQREYHGVHVGAYSFAGCLEPGVLPPGTVVGKYTAVSKFAHVYRRNHPFDWLSQHAFFYHPRIGPHSTDRRGVEKIQPLEIGNDAYVGDHAIILPNCRRIGDGAVIGAGAVVTKDVPDFAVVGGNPARLLRFRFPEQAMDMIRASRWWDRPLQEVIACLPEMSRIIDDCPTWHPLLNNANDLESPAPPGDQALSMNIQ